MSDSAPQPDRLPEWVRVGRIRGAHGVRGEILVEVESDTEGRFDEGVTLWIGRRERQIVASRPHKGQALLRLHGVDDREAAASLRGEIVEIPRTQVPPAPEGEFYYYELVGCRVVDDGEGELGSVVSVLEDGGGLLLEVVGSAPAANAPDDPAGQPGDAAEERSLLIPFVRAHLIEVDVEGALVRTRLPVGLVELCSSTS